MCGLRRSPKESDGPLSVNCRSSSCRIHENGEEDMSGHAMVGQASPDVLSGDGNDSTDSRVVIGVANVHVDAVLL